MRVDRLGRLRTQFGGSLVTTGTRLIDLPCRYGMHLLIALRLPLSEVGAFYIVYGAVTIAAGLGRLGVDKALTRGMARGLAHGDTRSARGTMLRAFALVGGMSLALALLAAALAWPIATLALHKPELAPLFLIGALIVVPQNLANVAAGALAGLQRVTLSQIVYTWLWPAIFCVSAFLLPLTAARALGTIAASMVAALLIAGTMLLFSLPRRPDAVPGAMPAQAVDVPVALLSTGFSLFSLELVQLLISAAPTFALGIFAPTAEAGLYAIAWRVVLVIYMFVSGVASMVSPRFARLYMLGDRDGLRREASKAIAFALSLSLLPIVLVTIEPVRILELFGRSYVQADLTLRILLVGQLAVTLTTTTPELLGMTGYARSLFKINIVALVLLIAGLAVCTPGLGAEGAALAVAATMIFNAISATIMSRRKLGFFPLGALYAVVRAGRSAVLHQDAASAMPVSSGVQPIPRTSDARVASSRIS